MTKPEEGASPMREQAEAIARELYEPNFRWFGNGRELVEDCILRLSERGWMHKKDAWLLSMPPDKYAAYHCGMKECWNMHIEPMKAKLAALQASHEALRARQAACAAMLDRLLDWCIKHKWCQECGGLPDSLIAEAESLRGKESK